MDFYNPFFDFFYIFIKIVHLYNNRKPGKEHLMSSQRQFVIKDAKVQPKRGQEVLIDGIAYYVMSSIKFPNRSNMWIAQVTKFKKFC